MRGMAVCALRTAGPKDAKRKPSSHSHARPWKSPIKKREGRTCLRTHPACLPS